MNRKKKHYKTKELELKSKGVKHIRYTKHGVPLPDWDKILREVWDAEYARKKKSL